MKRGFFSQKGSGVGRGVKEKQVSMADKLVEGRKHVNVVNAGLESFSTVYEEHGIQSSACNEENINDVGNKAVNHPYFHLTGLGTRIDVVCDGGNRSESISRKSTTDGLNSMLENGPWFICNHPLILRKWNSDVDLLKEDVRNVLVWVKLHGVPIMVFSEDGLSAIATKLGTLLMLDSDTSDMCLQSWGRSSYARVMIELWADIELKYNIMVVIPKIMVFGHTQGECPWNIGLGVAKNLKKPSQTSRGVPVGLKVGSKPHKEYRPVPKKTTASPSDNKKKGTINLVNNEANSSESFFMNVENSSTSYTPIIDKIRKFKDLLIDRQAILVDEASNPLKKVECLSDYDSEDEVASVDNDMARSLASEKVGFGTQSFLEKWRDSYGNGDYDEDPYDDDMYEGQDLP
ncbi:putative reverse transcriptase domain-containing protein [Tanacetum coccineum]|uniref:Reverse transcriptase domain-containing protein n=1 Tax=Tanacetum coccineum TaxID=301880 RepID=A0ABQ4YPW5_9ASTR